MPELLERSCQPLPTGTPALSADQIERFLAQVPGWVLSGGQIERAFEFKDHYAAMAFVNAIAWVSHQQDHHPDMRVGYNGVVVAYATHSIGGISENDFICAARVNALGA